MHVVTKIAYIAYKSAFNGQFYFINEMTYCISRLYII